MQSVDDKDESAFIYWELAESGIEFVQSNLAELLDGGGLPVAVGSVHDGHHQPVNLIKLLASHLPGMKNKFMIPTALFSLDHKPSENKTNQDFIFSFL